MASNSKSEDHRTNSSTFNFGKPVIASTSVKVDQDTSLSPFNLGDLVLAKLKTKGLFGGGEIIWLSVICPDFGTSDKYTEEKDLLFAGFTRFYHVQRLGCKFERAWLAEYQLEIIEHDTVQDIMSIMGILSDKVARKYCQMFVNKTNKEMVEICRIRAEIFDSFKSTTNGNLDSALETEIFELKTENIILKYQLESNKESLGELKNELKSFKQTFEEVNNIVMSQNSNHAQNEQETKSENLNANDNAKMDIIEDHVEELQKLNRIIKDLKKDNVKLSNENVKLSDEENENYVVLLKQNEVVIKNLKEDNLNLHKEVGVLKYGS